MQRCLLVLVTLVLGGRTEFAAQVSELPPPVARRVDFARDVQPILVGHCTQCHSGEKPQAGLSLHRLEDLIQGGTSGAAIVPGASADSLLIHRVAGSQPPRMPLSGKALSDEQISVLRAWIDEGARWDHAERRLEATARLAPRKPEVPASDWLESSHPIDRFVGSYFERNRIETADPVTDALFARRAYLDLWGLTPSPEQLEAFLNNGNDGKRARLVDRLLAHERHYSEHWISFWNDWLRNDEGVIYHGQRKSITDWLLAALERNLPYNQMVRALLDPSGEDDPDGFLIGVTWRGTINASQTPPMQAAQNSAQVFLGINIKCASCHDSFINQWKLKDSYGLASFFIDEPLELVRCDVPQGVTAETKFLFPELGGIDGKATLAEKRRAAAELFTKRENGRFARTLVNRYWKRLFGHGLVEPADDMDQPPWDADLLDWLAEDFAEHGYDLKHLLRRVMTSTAYQLPAVPTAEAIAGDYLFRGPYVRRLTAEQFVDSVSAITGEWRVRQRKPIESAQRSREWRLKSSPLTRAMGRPVRDQVTTQRNEQATMLQGLELVNGGTLARTLERGAKRMLGRLAAAPRNLFDSGRVGGKAMEIEVDLRGAQELWLVVVDEDSYDPNRITAGWAAAELIGPAGSVPLRELIDVREQPLRPLRFGDTVDPDAVAGGLPSQFHADLRGRRFQRLLATIGVDEASRASDINPRLRYFVFAEKPNREQLINVAAGAPVETEAAPAEALVERLYRQAFGRKPSPQEKAIAEQSMRAEGTAESIATEGLEDLIWSVFLSPEFEYIR